MYFKYVNMDVNSEFLNLTYTMVHVRILFIKAAGMLQECCSPSVRPMYMCLKYVNNDVNFQAHKHNDVCENHMKWKLIYLETNYLN